MSSQNPSPFDSSSHAAPAFSLEETVVIADDTVPAPSKNTNPLATLIPAAIVFSGFLVCAILWMFAGNSPIMRVIGVLVILGDIVCALIMRKVLLNVETHSPDAAMPEAEATNREL